MTFLTNLPNRLACAKLGFTGLLFEKMSSTDSVTPLQSFQTFGDLLKYLRRRARLTQRELGIAVGYSEAQISRLEQNQRPPDLAALMALFIPSLYIEEEPGTIARLMDLAAQARGEILPKSGQITFSHSVRSQVSETVQIDSLQSNNLPLPMTSFIGREREIEEIKNLLDTAHDSKNSRFVTLTGFGGSGKTRLALQSARGLFSAFADGVWLVELAAITNPLHVPQAVITTLGSPEPRDGTPLNALIKYLRQKQVLLILDNCEQIVSAAAGLADKLLSACPRVRILATSREVLNIPGEIVLRVDPLSLPQAGESGSTSESVRLFVDRGKTVIPAFELTEENASSVAQICSRLDGIPLAIELAAARLNVLSVDQVAALLDKRFDLLTTGYRTNMPRQQTLRAALDWSYDLLSEEDKKSFHQLSVFAGDFDMDGAMFVLGTSVNALEAISRFADKSLVVVDHLPVGGTRYHLLESIREYSLDKLRETGDEANIRAMHFDYFLNFAKEANLKLRGKDQVEWMKRLEREQENLRAALKFASEASSPAMALSGLRLALALDHFWFLCGHGEERTEWVERFVQLPQQPRLTPEYARALGLRAHWQNTADETLRMLEEGFSLGRMLQDDSALAALHFSRAAYSWTEDDPSLGYFHFDKSIEIYRKLGNRWQVARKLAELGEFAQVRLNERELARRSLEESLQISRELEDQRGMAFALIRLGDLVIEQNKLAEAKQFCSEGLVLAGELNDVETLAWGINDLGVVAMCEGNLDEAERMCAESLVLSRDWGAEWHVIIRRYWLARVIAYQKDDARAGALHEENRIASENSNFDWGLAASLQGLGDLALRRGDLEKTLALHSDAIRILHNGHYGYSLAYSLDSFAALALAKSQPERAVLLLAAAEALRESIHTALLPPEQAEREQLLDQIKQSLPSEKITSLTEQGQGMSHDEAVEFALNNT